uniref:Uncharacterized protein n=1 Tax=Candidatus Kentrum sp. LFY TaxID=2126342 RepID=A0A450U7H7_9GAMM|nr:MAG: hypothetical protein BECKLFY1418A_GA0070994_100246 [Candidatus Kentron sp. LFY]VFJ89405.1 MAG: hypothetical protein BECKLFY1418B_GA0070995_10154 [Candidatus Kentron sp. LFY]
MNLRELYTGHRPFSDNETILAAVRNSSHFDEDAENIGNTGKVQLLSTSKQKTYLVGTAERIYKVLDDRREQHPKVIWSRKIDEVFMGDSPVATLFDYNGRTSNLVVAAVPDKMNLVSKDLFENIGVMDAIAGLGNAR